MNDLYQSNENLVPVTGNHGGLSVVTACLFIVGEIAGTGILALPNAIKSCGWSGAFAITLICIAFGFTGVLLGECWNILEIQDASLKEIKTRNAYSLIGQRAAGKIGEYVTTVSLAIQMFGGAIVLLLLLSEIVERLALRVGIHLTFCEWLILMGVVLLPLTFAGSPVDFWPVAVSAMSSTAIASVLLMIEITRQNYNKQPESEDVTTTVASIMETVSSTIDTTMATSMGTTAEPTGDELPPEFHVTGKTYFLGLSTMAFGFAGASAIPTIQNDMVDKKKFKYSAIAAFALLLLIYLPVAMVGYYFYGNGLQGNIVRNLNPSFITTTIDVLMVIHIFSAFLIVINPVNLFLEHAIKIKHCKYLDVTLYYPLLQLSFSLPQPST